MKNIKLPDINHDSVFFYLLATFILTLPYNISTWWIGAFSITLALTTLTNPSQRTNIQSLFNDRVILALFIFIIFTYVSVLWSNAPDIFTGDLKTNIGRFKYAFLIVPAIYLSNLKKRDIKILFIVIALAPSLSILIYYTNYFDLSNIFPAQNPSSNLILRHYLRQNFFILFSLLYLYINIFTAIKENTIAKLLTYLTLFIFIALSLILDIRTDSRLIDLAFILILVSVPVYYLKPRVYFALIIILLSLSATVIYNYTPFQKGIQNFSQAIQTDTYTGSWGHRLGYAIVGIEIFKKNPIIGRGIDDITRPIETISKTQSKYFVGEHLRYFHNEHINILVATGIVGYLLFLYFILVFFKIRINDKKIHVFKNITIITLMFIMMGDHYLSIKETINFILILITLIVTFKSIDDKETNINKTR